MYVVTFYSYKGGVGRTMALVNTAVSLARSGRRVLVVDFDLEAPGLPSYQVFRNAECGRGIVDYVTSYRATGIAPNAAEFITACDIDGAPLWIMPAGHHTRPGYTEALNPIDWQDLYEHQEGYLMFEDLKQQWAQYEGLGFDYVLIDSRTGHTDVGGICTRQLPDTVGIMFLPNDQNITGLVPIVEGIRLETKSRKKRIDLHFCPSNVPDLDDEKDILSGLLDDARTKLGYRRSSTTTLNHYSSLDLLAQPAFVISRPNSRLAKQYEALRMAIVATNFADREGALVALGGMPDILERARSSQGTQVRDRVRRQVIDIRALHPDDGNIAFLAARVFSDIGDQTAELEALSVAIKQGHEVNRSRIARALLYSVFDQRDESMADLYEILASPTATIFELGPALQILQSIDSLWATRLDMALDRPDSEFKTLLSLSTFVMSVRDGLPPMARRMRKSMDSEILTPEQKRQARNLAILALIGSGDFAEAKILINGEGNFSSTTQPEDLFNYAIAEWGETRMIPESLFELVADRVQVTPPRADPNFHQCLALTYATLGHVDLARKELDIARRDMNSGNMQFSCWRFLNVSDSDMLEDIAAMEEQLILGVPLQPAFFEETRRLVH